VKIAILSSSQHESLRVALAALLPGAQLASFDVGPAQRDEPARARIAAALQACDHVVTVPLPSTCGALGTAALREAPPRVHLLPSLQFGGFHPDVVTLRLDHDFIAGPTGHSHSRIAIAGFLAGLPPRETAGLYNRLAFARLGYLNRFGEQRALLIERFAPYGIALEAPFEAWLARGCFMHDVGHPRMRVMLDLARAACTLMGLAPAPVPEEAALPDPLSAFAIHPVFPDIAAAIGVPPSGAFRPALRPGASPRVMGAEAFVRASHDAYARLPLSVLRRADGVPAAMAALDLHAAPRARPAPRRVSETTTAFLTWHGTLLGIETASGMMMQRAFLPDDADSTDLLADLPGLPVTAKLQANLMGGVEMAPLPDGGVSFARGKLFLCAVPSDLAMRFDRPSASLWESFLPVPATVLGHLRALAAGTWHVAGTRLNLPGAVMRLLPGFRFAVGDAVLDLRHEYPEAVHEPDGVTAYRIPAGGQTLLLRPASLPSAGGDRLLLDSPAETRAAEIGTPEEFRLWRHARLRLQGPDELLHAPLTACDADRDWMFKHHFDRAGMFHLPGLGRHAFQANLLRGSDELLMLGRGVEGILLGPDGLDKDGGFLSQLTKMPDGLRAVGKSYLLRRAAAAQAPVIDGPVCVFYNPNLQNYYHWIAEALLALHIMQSYLPAGTRLILPPALEHFRRTGETMFDHLSFLQALGFGKLPVITPRGGYVRLRDAIWLDSDAIYGLPAVALQSFRARARAMRPPAGPRRRLYIKRAGSRQVGNSPAVEATLRRRGFETVTLENVPAAEQIDMFVNAEFVIATHGSAMTNLMFCQKGTKVLELTPDSDFRTYFWLMAEKLGLPYGVLPCATDDRDFNGTLNVDIARFRALFRVLRTIETE
jgi:hypothetical protein